MRPRTATLLLELASESFRDAARRRIVPVVVVMAVISLLAVDSCTSFVGDLTVGGGFSSSQPTGWAGVAIFSLLSLWTMALAGLLASDHLAETLFDGSANLVLSRPVRRREFALARLLGALGIAGLTGAVVLTVSTILIFLQSDVSLVAALLAGFACAAGSIVVAALAMALSLVLARVATALCVFVFVFGVAGANLLELFDVSLGGLGHALQYFTPPLLSAVVLALEPWVAQGPTPLSAHTIVIMLKLVFWVVVSVGVLLAVFQRQELKA